MRVSQIVVVDFETGSANPDTCEVLQLAAVVLDANRLTLGNTFNSLIKPEIPENVEKEALDITKLKMDDLLKAPTLKQVFGDFVNFVHQVNVTKSKYEAPVMGGYNITTFDIPIMNRLCVKFGQVDKKKNKPNLFHSILKYDLLDDIWRWDNFAQNLENKKLTTVLEFMGLEHDNAHNALYDCINTAKVIIKFLNLYKRMTNPEIEGPKVIFKNAFKNL